MLVDRASGAAAFRGAADLTAEALEVWRAPLVGFCYRMLASSVDAEDCVQEVLTKAWRHAEQFDPGRGSVKGWLFGIATHVCLDMLRTRERRRLVLDLAEHSEPGPDLGQPLPGTWWVEPAPQAWLASSPDAGPEGQLLLRESIRLAIVAAMQTLTARQRAALLLCDAFGLPAREVADALETSVASVTSSLQRARTTLRTAREEAGPVTDRSVDESLLTRYCAAFEAYDIDGLIELMHEDVRSSMPPYPWWLKGRREVEASLRAPSPHCAGSRTVAVEANAAPAFGQYRVDSRGGYRAFALVVLTTRGSLISEVTTFLAADELFPVFDLPLTLPQGA